MNLYKEKKMFYKKIKIHLLILILFFSFSQTCFCNGIKTEEDLMANLQHAKTTKQKMKANKELFYYYINLGNYESAVSVADDLLTFKLSKKQKYNIYYNLAKAYLALSKTEKASEAGQEAQYLYPKKKETKLLLGNIYKNNGLNELAIVKFKECLDIDKDNIEALINLANIYNVQGFYKTSLEYFEKARKKSLENKKDLSSNDYINMAISAKETGKTEQAQYILENIDGKNKKTALLLADIYKSKLHFDKAIEEILPFVDEEQPDVEIYCNLAHLYLLSGKFKEAQNLLLDFKSKNNDVEAIDLLLIESYNNLYHNKAKELKYLNRILEYTKSEYIKNIIKKVIEFEKK